MKIYPIFLCLLLPLGKTTAAPLSQADREALLGNLEKIQTAANTHVDERYATALNAFRSAMGSSTKAYELYLNCVQKVDYEEQQKPDQEFREWKRKQEDALSQPAFHTALRYQLGWLVLTLQASAKKPDRAKLASDILTTLSALFAEGKDLASEKKTLEQNVTETVFARAYKVTNAKPEKWPLSPTAIDKIFDDFLLPPLRQPELLASLKEAWLRRIQLETLKHESSGSTEKDRPGPNPETNKFLTDERPKLQWAMEKDLFQAGDESGGAIRMLTHIQNNLTHPSAAEWSQELKTLLAPDAAATK